MTARSSIPLLAALAAGLAGMAAAVPARAQEDPDVAFVTALVNRGWAVVAEPVIDRHLSSPGDAHKERYQVLRVMLRLQAARRAPGTGREEAFAEALKAIDEISKADLKVVKAGDQASLELGEFFLEAAGLLSDEGRRSADPARAEEFSKRAAGMVDQAEKIFQARLQEAQALGAKATAGSEEETDDSGDTKASRAEMDAAYNLARALMQRGSVLERKEEKDAAFKAAIRNLEDFQATFAGTPLAYQAAILTGQCYSEMGEFKKALGAFSGVAALVEQYRDPDTGKVVVDNSVAADLIQRSLYLKAQAANKPQAARYADAQKAASGALALFPEIARKPIGLAIRVELARSLRVQDKPEESQRILDEVVKDDPDGPFGSDARSEMSKLVTVLKTEGDLGQALLGLLERKDYTNALATCRFILAGLDRSTEKERAAKAPDILVWLGKIYAAQDRQQEAAIVFEEVIDRFPKHKAAPEACFEAVKARLLGDVAAPSAFDKERYGEDLKRLNDSYRDSPFAAAGQFLIAEKYFKEEKFEKAAEIYISIPASAGQFHDLGLFRGGLSLWTLASRTVKSVDAKPLYGRAEKAFLDCLKACQTSEPGLAPERVQDRAKLRVASRAKLADIYVSYAMNRDPKARRYEDALKVIEATDKEDHPDPEQAELLTVSRVQALASVGRLEEAETAFARLREKWPNSRTIPFVARDLAYGFGRKAGEARKATGGEKDAEGNATRNAKEDKEYQAAISKELEFYGEWISQSKRLKLPVNKKALQGPRGIATRALAIALELTGLPEKKDSFTDCLGREDIPRDAWERAVVILEEARPKPGEVKEEDLCIFIARLGRAYGFKGDWAKARDAFEEALVRGGLLSTTGEKKPVPKKDAVAKNTDLLDWFIELGFSELIPGRKGGLDRAKEIFAAAFVLTDRDTCAWWKCRYGFIASEIKEGSYSKAEGLLNIASQAPEWSGPKCGLGESFDLLQAEIAARKPGAAPGKEKVSASAGGR